MTKKIWIIGIGGMLGRAVFKKLQEEKISVVGTTRQEVDITSLNDIRAFFSKEPISHIINCAAYTNVDFAEKEKKEAFAVNVVGPRNIAHIAREGKAKIIHFSSDYIFDGKKNDSYCEEDSPNPSNYYGKTKWEGERILLELCPDCCILRTSWLFGSGGTHFVGKMVEQMQQKRQVCVVSDQWGRMTAAKDLAEIVPRMLPHSGIYHFANRERTNWYEITRYLNEHAQENGWNLACQQIFPVSSKSYQARALRPLYSVLDTTKIENLLGVSLRSWKEALKEFLNEEFLVDS